MDNNKQSILSKIAEKGVISPFEAIHLQYLNRQHQLHQIPDVNTWPNPYVAVENVSEIISSYQLKNILSFKNQQDGALYDAYRWAAGYMTHLDANIGDVGYKGIAILNELRYIRDENVLRIITDEEAKRNITGTLFDFSAYSRVHQKRMTFNEVLGEFAFVFRCLVMSIDTILTLNYFLNNIAEKEDLKCLQYLEMWLAQEKASLTEDENAIDPLFNCTHICLEKTFYFLLNKNHIDFVEFMKTMLGKYGENVPGNFQENSLQYVKETVEELAHKHELTLTLPDL